MSRRLAMVVVTAIVLSGCFRAQNVGRVNVAIETEKGVVEVTLDSAHAPITVANFLRYVDAAAFDEGSFHRTVRPDNQADKPVKIDVIQASGRGDVTRSMSQQLGPIELERTNVTTLSHRDGAISMARGAPNTATSSFFICIGPQPELDFGGKRNADGQGFAAFGWVTKGMDVVKAIQLGPAEGETLKPAIRITRVRRIK